MSKDSLSNENRVIDELLSVIKTGRNFCFLGHHNPDADVIGSQLAMRSLIQRVDPSKSVTIKNNGAPPLNLSFLPGFKGIQNVNNVEGVFDSLFFFECPSLSRTEMKIDIEKQGPQIVNIDHHLNNEQFAHVNFVDPEASSTAEMVFKIFKRAGLLLNKDEATSIFAGLVSDTGWFRYGNTQPETLRIGADLLEAGVPSADISEKIYMGRTEKALRLLGLALSQMKLQMDGKISVMRIPQSVFKEFRASPDDLDEIVNYGLMIESAIVSILLKENQDNGTVKVSLRSKNQWDVNQLARKLGGGGHKNASGCTLQGTMDEVEKKVLDEAKRIV